MRIIHTSDWHLGRIFHGVHLTEDQAYILEELTLLIKDKKPDVLLVAGDIFDRSVPPVEAVNLLDETISKIILDFRIPIIMISGNHDSADRIHFGSRLMGPSKLNVTGRFSKNINPLIIEDKFGSVFFYSLPYAEPAIIREVLEDEEIHSHDDSMKKIIAAIGDNMDKSKRNVLISHTFVAGGEGSESERPLSIGGTSVVDSSYFKDFDYVALGHLHRPQKVTSETIRYSGSLMKYSFSEADQKKHIPIIEMDGKGTVSIEKIELRPKRDVRCIEGYLEDLLNHPEECKNKEDYLMVTLKDEGAILDAMGKIRRVYPNTLHIERPQMLLSTELRGPDSNFKKMDIKDLFSSFFNQVTDSKISDEHLKAFEEILSKHNGALRWD
ncbi:nuclease SbcCD subunit D [Oxobacter pfennigii]|uniref:Nuclease SbcCD subunit D n=1 Tax=Oxobacter pfennigii TaxID=36849 RepID=A0A0P8YDW5_9CLOT|nr:exonuclease SbcCD subunit D [Oxobacter pfennigii]KPU45428.1 nuclease SbcCD subunit D [Oxobacter pfennigii]